MLAIEVEYLMGRAIATRIDERNQAEWPPHPQRLFSALVAALAELGSGVEGQAALEWLESLPAPAIRADLSATPRQVSEHFVPVNDESVRAEKGKADFRHPLERRNRQSRFFPATVLNDPVVTFQWVDLDGSLAKHRPTLQRLVENITYLGHSASPVRACLRDVAVKATWIPDEDGSHQFRVPKTGRLRRLEQVHQQRQIDEGMQAPLGALVAYAQPGLAQSLFSPRALVLSFTDGPKLSLDVSLPLMQHLRSALLSRLKDRQSPTLSGHDTDGQPTRESHLALAPLGFVGSPYADGSLKGAALILPRAIDPLDRRRLRTALDETWKLHLGSLGSISVTLLQDEQPVLRTLNLAASYIGPSKTWASVTPVVLDRHPKKNGRTAEDIVAASCEHIGLPRPAEIRLGPLSVFTGSPAVREFQRRSSQADGRLSQHVLLRFADPVQGPMLIGAGRFVGLGLCRPWHGGRGL